MAGGSGLSFAEGDTTRSDVTRASDCGQSAPDSADGWGRATPAPNFGIDQNTWDQLQPARDALVDDGAMLVVDERTRESFDGTPDELESYFYGWSVFDCLPSGLAGSPSAGTGAVMRPETLRGYATAAGFTRFDVLPIVHDTFRLYLLRP